MSQPDSSDPLESKVGKLVEKAERASEADTIQSRISRATTNIDRLYRELRKLENQTESLLFYNGVLTDVFTGDSIDEVRRSIKRVGEVSDISDEELLDATEERATNDYTRSVEDAQTLVRSAKASSIEQIREYQRRRNVDIQAARDLNQVIGGAGDEFEEVLNGMEHFLENEIWDEETPVSYLSSKWNELIGKWDEHAGRHGWEAFQDEHDLSDETMAALRKIADAGSLRLEEVTNEVVEEMKSVPDLNSAIRMEIGSR